MRAIASTTSRFAVWALLLFVLGCPQGPEPPPLPPEQPVPADLAEYLTGLGFAGPDFDEDVPSLHRRATRPVTSPAEAYAEILALYPRLGPLVRCWSELAGHYVFSLAPPGLEYTVMLYVPIGGREIRYFQPHA